MLYLFNMYFTFSLPVYLCARAFLRWSWGILVVVVQNRPLTPICCRFLRFHTIHITHHSFLKPSQHHLWQIIGVSPYINMLSVFLNQILSYCGFNQNAKTSLNCVESCLSYYYIVIHQLTCLRGRVVALVTAVGFKKSASISDIIFHVLMRFFRFPM